MLSTAERYRPDDATFARRRPRQADIRELTYGKQRPPRGGFSKLQFFLMKCPSGTTELGSCLTDATREGRSRRAIRKVAATLEPELLC